MKIVNFILATVLLMTGARAQSKDEVALQQVLKQMESVGRTFHNFTAHITQRKYTAVLKEFDTPESGEFYYERAKDGSALIRREITKPAAQILTIKGGVATIYQPGVNQAQLVNLGKNKDKAEFLALGVGQSPASLRQTFDITYQGSETVNSVPCSVLLLKPKNPSAAAYYPAITLWMSKSSGISVQVKLQEPSGDYVLYNFSDPKLNGKIPGSKFEQKLPANVEIQKIQ